MSIRLQLILLTLVFLPRPAFSQAGGVVTPDDFALYHELNNREARLAEFKDSDEALRMKLMQLNVINRSRKKLRVSPVKLDIFASRVANRMCREAALNNYLSHWNLAGEKPYQRYAFAGGLDHISENAYGEWTTGTFDTPDNEVYKLMEAGHKSFMAEKAPNDGHKKTIAGKSHNFVGIGFFKTDNQFRYYEEFIDRYLEFENIPSSLKVNQSGSITIRTDGTNYPYFLVIYREKFPLPLKVAQLKKTGSYPDYSNEEYIKIPAWELAKYRNDNTYIIPLRFAKEGLYYVHIYLDRKEIKKPSAIDTKGKTEGSGIVIKVQD